MASPTSFEPNVRPTSPRPGQRVAVALDDSPHSWRALEYTLDFLVDPKHDHLVLVTACQHAESWSDTFVSALMAENIAASFAPFAGGSTTALEDESRKKAVDQNLADQEQAKTMLRKAAALVREHHHAGAHDPHIPFSIELVQGGSAAEAIVSYVNDKAHAIGLLVLGTRGLGAFKRAIIGSVSDYCLHHVRCPTVIVKNDQA
ncbi:hypothetical protein GGF32_003914 [Allomyces javanicus]|nr:hypothetical protein GGF32_003914 [Allomyces javanicus]